MDRNEANWKLINHLQYLQIKYPDLRFSQILQNFASIKPLKGRSRTDFDWSNEFNLEGEDLLKRVEQRIKDMEKDT